MTWQLFSTPCSLKKADSTHTPSILERPHQLEAGIPDIYIKMIGRWQNNAYLCYIRAPPEILAKLSQQSAAGSKQGLTVTKSHSR